MCHDKTSFSKKLLHKHEFMKDHMICAERYEFMIDHGSYTHNLSSCEIKA